MSHIFKFGTIASQSISTTTTSWIVTFEDWDGTVLETQIVPHGEDADPHPGNVRQGYIFVGWTDNYTNVTSDRTVTALYVVANVKWSSGGSSPSGPSQCNDHNDLGNIRCDSYQELEWVELETGLGQPPEPAGYTDEEPDVNNYINGDIVYTYSTFFDTWQKLEATNVTYYFACEICVEDL